MAKRKLFRSGKEFRPKKQEIVKLIEKDDDNTIWYNTGSVWPSRHKKSDDLKVEVWIEEHNRILKPNKKYTLIIDYPVRSPFEYSFTTNEKGMTLREVVDLAVKKYKQMYKEEDKSTSIKPMTMKEASKGKCSLLNRVQTDGKYGIYGHDLSHLTITNVGVKGNKIYLSVDS